jgi:hypothetical protein
MSFYLWGKRWRRATFLATPDPSHFLFKPAVKRALSRGRYRGAFRIPINVGRGRLYRACIDEQTGVETTAVAVGSLAARAAQASDIECADISDVAYTYRDSGIYFSVVQTSPNSYRITGNVVGAGNLFSTCLKTTVQFTQNLDDNSPTGQIDVALHASGSYGQSGATTGTYFTGVDLAAGPLEVNAPVPGWPGGFFDLSNQADLRQFDL